jgi:hypothetical protein
LITSVADTPSAVETRARNIWAPSSLGRLTPSSVKVTIGQLKTTMPTNPIGLFVAGSVVAAGTCLVFKKVSDCCCLGVTGARANPLRGPPPFPPVRVRSSPRSVLGRARFTVPPFSRPRLPDRTSPSFIWRRGPNSTDPFPARRMGRTRLRGRIPWYELERPSEIDARVSAVGDGEGVAQASSVVASDG